MIVLLSPAKSLDFESPNPVESYSVPDFLEETDTLISRCRKLSENQLKKLMGISDKLAALNAQRFTDYERPEVPDSTARQAALAFTGDTYVGLDASTMSDADLAFAQDHVRILSGLYGVLRPLDLIRPYRLEMGSKLNTRGAKNLYEFWGPTPAKAISEALEGHESPVIVNCASNEYFKAVDTKALGARVITPVFQDFKNGKYKVISFFAKRARGAMAAYVVRNRITNPDDLLAFDWGGYAYAADLSTDDAPVFTRNQEA